MNELLLAVCVLAFQYFFYKEDGGWPRLRAWFCFKDKFIRRAFFSKLREAKKVRAAARKCKKSLGRMHAPTLAMQARRQEIAKELAAYHWATQPGWFAILLESSLDEDRAVWRQGILSQWRQEDCAEDACKKELARLIIAEGRFLFSRIKNHPEQQFQDRIVPSLLQEKRYYQWLGRVWMMSFECLRAELPDEGLPAVIFREESIAGYSLEQTQGILKALRWKRQEPVSDLSFLTESEDWTPTEDLLELRQIQKTA